MRIIINTSSMVPIYEQIMDQIKKMVISKELKNGDNLPSVRALAAELKISALTVKKAYDLLEEEGYIATVHGKGSYVKNADPEMMAEQRYRQIEEEMALIVQKARSYGLEDEEIIQLLDLILEDK
ncbi:MAG: GntR family transcriptional regulator [Erysipelotrichaceae bacterium]|nr:GntR family transcriptional regulator [Erysipelotrichaceae bacterium]